MLRYAYRNLSLTVSFFSLYVKFMQKYKFSEKKVVNLQIN